MKLDKKAKKQQIKEIIKENNKKLQPKNIINKPILQGRKISKKKAKKILRLKNIVIN